MQKCSEDCLPACDFCIHLDRKQFDDGEAPCKLHGKIVDFGYYCDDFHCFNVERCERESEFIRAANEAVAKMYKDGAQW